MQWGRNNDTITLNCAGMLELLFGKRAKSADDLPLSSSASIPPLLTHFSHHSLLFSHTLDLVHSTDVIFLGEVLGCKRKQEIYAKLHLDMYCGFCSFVGNISNFSPSSILISLASSLCFQLCVILFASCTKQAFSKV